MTIKISLSAALLSLVCAMSYAQTAGDWYKAPERQKRAEVSRVLGNIGSQPGCRVKKSDNYYFQALNAMLAEDTSASNLNFSQALALIGTAAEGDWCPGR